MATLVKFRKQIGGTFDGEIVAVFPQLLYNKRMHGTGMKQGYAHIGQHSPVHIDWVKNETEAATPEEYAALKAELEQIGYTLKICK